MRDGPAWRRYLRFWGVNPAADLDDEFRFHLETEIEELVASGLSPERARAAALERFGSVEAFRAECAAADARRRARERRADWWDTVRQDVRHTWRAFRRDRRFLATALLTLTIGIGATTTIFSAVYAALLRPLPYPEPARLVFVSDQRDAATPMSYPEVEDWAAQGDVFAELAAYFTTSLVLAGAGDPEVLSGARVSASLPRLLGVRPSLGRAFRAEEELPGAEKVILLSDALWRRRFAADPAAVGRVVTLSGNPYTVIGVLPAGLEATLPTDLASTRAMDYWVPLRLDAERAPRGLHFLTVVGRLRPGVDLARARARLTALAAQMRQSDRDRHGVTVGALAERVTGEARPLLLLLLGAVAIVLLVTWVNVANLLLVRGVGRQREFAIRGALGASRRRVVRQLLTESVVLATAAGVLGVGVAYGGLAALRGLAGWSSGAAALPRVAQAQVDAGVLAFALGLSAATGIGFGLLPALRVSRGMLAPVLRSGGRGTTARGARDRLRSTLVILEVALSFVLLIGAGLLVRSFDRLLTVDKGYDPTQVLTFEITLPPSRYPDARAQTAFFGAVVERVGALPGVESAALTASLPLGGGSNGGFTLVGRPTRVEDQPMAEKRVVTGAFFRTLRVPLVAGRTFDARDVAGAPQVAIVNQSFVRRYFPNESPLGRRLEFDWDTEGAQEIVGVVGDMRERTLREPPVPTIYVPFGQRLGDPAMVVVARAAGDPARLVAGVRSAVRSVDPGQPISAVGSLDELVSRGAAGQRVAMSLFGAFGVLSLVLAAVGLYVVISSGVTARVQELGVRRALGARGRDVVRLVLAQGARLLLLGVVVGGAAALGGARMLRSLLFGVGVGDLATFLGVAAVLALTALAAMLVPAVRASRIDPLAALREE